MKKTDRIIDLDSLKDLKKILIKFADGKTVHSKDGQEMGLYYAVGIVNGMIKYTRTLGEHEKLS